MEVAADLVRADLDREWMLARAGAARMVAARPRRVDQQELIAPDQDVLDLDRAGPSRRSTMTSTSSNSSCSLSMSVNRSAASRTRP